MKVGIAFVVMKKNIDELSNLGALAKRVGAQMVSVSNVIPYSRDMVEQMVCDLDVEKVHQTNYLGSVPVNIPIIDKTELTKQPLYELFRDNNNISIMKNKVGAEVESCRFIKERCTFVRWDGKVSPCMVCFIPIKPMSVWRKPKGRSPIMPSVISGKRNSKKSGTPRISCLQRKGQYL